MDTEVARFNMIEQQIRPGGVLTPAVLEALAVVRRERFVPPPQRALAFADVALPLGHGHSMLPPLLAARLVEALQPRRGERVLEIGSGSGYLAALLATCGAHVLSLEIEPELAEQARLNLAAAGIDNVRVEAADGATGWRDAAPFDAIVATGTVREIPAAWLEQLRVGGRLLACVGSARFAQVRRVTRQGENEYLTRPLFETALPPLRLARPVLTAL